MASPSTRMTFLVTVTVTASFGLSSLNDLGTWRLESNVMADVDDENDLSKNTRMMVIMSIIGVMLRSLITSGSASLRAKERIAFLPASRETSGVSGPAIYWIPAAKLTSGNKTLPSSAVLIASSVAITMSYAMLASALNVALVSSAASGVPL